MPRQRHDVRPVLEQERQQATTEADTPYLLKFRIGGECVEQDAGDSDEQTQKSVPRHGGRSGTILASDNAIPPA